MGISLRDNQFAKERASKTYSKYGASKSPGLDWGSVALSIWGIVVIVWWLLKIVALWIFVTALIEVLGALFNNNPPLGHDIAWTIIGFLALIVL